MNIESPRGGGMLNFLKDETKKKKFNAVVFNDSEARSHFRLLEKLLNSHWHLLWEYLNVSASEQHRVLLCHYRGL